MLINITCFNNQQCVLYAVTAALRALRGDSTAALQRGCVTSVIAPPIAR